MGHHLQDGLLIMLLYETLKIRHGSLLEWAPQLHSSRAPQCVVLINITTVHYYGALTEPRLGQTPGCQDQHLPASPSRDVRQPQPLNTMQIKGHLCIVWADCPQLSSLYFLFCFQPVKFLQPLPGRDGATATQIISKWILSSARGGWLSFKMAESWFGEYCQHVTQGLLLLALAAWPRYRNMKFPDQSQRPNGFIISLINTTTHPVLAPPTICQVIQIFRNQNMTRFLQEFWSAPRKARKIYLWWKLKKVGLTHIWVLLERFN